MSSQEQPPPTCGPGMWALGHLWPPREVHTHTWLGEKGGAKVQEWSSWKVVWQTSYVAEGKLRLSALLSLWWQALCPPQSLGSLQPEATDAAAMLACQDSQDHRVPA